MYNAESPNEGTKMFNSIMKKSHFDYLGIFFIYVLYYLAFNTQIHTKWTYIEAGSRQEKQSVECTL